MKRITVITLAAFSMSTMSFSMQKCEIKEDQVVKQEKELDLREVKRDKIEKEKDLVQHEKLPVKKEREKLVTCKNVACFSAGVGVTVISGFALLLWFASGWHPYGM